MIFRLLLQEYSRFEYECSRLEDEAPGSFQTSIPANGRQPRKVANPKSAAAIKLNADHRAALLDILIKSGELPEYLAYDAVKGSRISALRAVLPALTELEEKGLIPNLVSGEQDVTGLPKDPAVRKVLGKTFPRVGKRRQIVRAENAWENARIFAAVLTGQGRKRDLKLLDRRYRKDTSILVDEIFSLTDGPLRRRDL